MIRVLMVCLGNICRSPLAEGILQNKVDPDEIVVASAGTAGYHVGNKPDHRSIAVAKKYGIKIAHQRCGKFTEQDFDDFDFIYVMDKSNYNNVIELSRNQLEKDKVKLLLNEVDLDINEVPDPYYGGIDGFENVFNLIDAACDVIAKNLSSK